MYMICEMKKQVSEDLKVIVTFLPFCQVWFLSSLGGVTVGDSVRRMMRTVGTNPVLGQYSLKGRKGKKNFQHLALCQVLISKSGFVFKKPGRQ